MRLCLPTKRLSIYTARLLKYFLESFAYADLQLAALLNSLGIRRFCMRFMEPEDR